MFVAIALIRDFKVRVAVQKVHLANHKAQPRERPATFVKKVNTKKYEVLKIHQQKSPDLHSPQIGAFSLCYNSVLETFKFRR